MNASAHRNPYFTAAHRTVLREKKTGFNRPPSQPNNQGAQTGATLTATLGLLLHQAQPHCNMSRPSDSSGRQGNTPQGTGRTKAYNLVYCTDQWHRHKHVILHYFASSPLCHAILKGNVSPPPMGLPMAVALLQDDARIANQHPRPPRPTEISPIYWGCTNNAEFEAARASLSIMDPGKFPLSDYRVGPQDLSVKWKQAQVFHGRTDYMPTETNGMYDDSSFLPVRTIEQRAYYAYHQAAAAAAARALDQLRVAEAGEPADAKEAEAEAPAGPIIQPVHPLERAQLMVAKFNQDTKTWRSNCSVNILQKAKLQQFITKTMDSATALAEYHSSEPHIQRLLYTEANSLLFDFFRKYVPHSMEYLIPERAKSNRDGYLIYKTLNSKTTMPSVNSGARLLQRITKARQKPGETYEAFAFRILYDLGGKYEEASGKRADRAIQRMVLTENVSSFYAAPMQAIITQDTLKGSPTPIEGSSGSITAVMRAYENANRTDFTKYLEKSKKKKKRAGGPRDQANMARGGRPRRNPGEPLTTLCTWCKKFRPEAPTKHKSSDCRIRKDHLQTICEVCQQRGHPAKWCPSKEGRAHLAENETQDSPRSPIRPADELSYSRALTAKDARSHLRDLENRNSTGNNITYRIVECKAPESL